MRQPLYRIIDDIAYLGDRRIVRSTAECGVAITAKMSDRATVNAIKIGQKAMLGWEAEDASAFAAEESRP